MRTSRSATARARGPVCFVPLVSGLAAAVLMFVRLFLPHPVGTANNGDALRLLCQLGANPDAPPKPTAKWFFVRFWYPLAPGTHCANYPTSEILPMRATAWVHEHVLGLSGVIDLREAALEYCVFVGLVIAALALILASSRLRIRVAVLCGLFLVLAEATFADYAASPFSETAALWGLLVAAVAVVAVVARGRHWRWAFLAAWAGAVFAVGAKNETITLAIPLALLLGTRRFELGRLSRGVSAGMRRVTDRIVPALCVLSLAMTAAWSLSSESVTDAQTNFGNEVTMTIMPMTSNPDAVATGLGLPGSWGKYSGTNWWTRGDSIDTDPQFPLYAHLFTDADLAKYLAKNPVLAARVFADAAPSYLQFRNRNLGSYPANAGYAPESQECRDCVLEDVSHALSWTGFTGVLAYWLACIGAALWLIRTSVARSRRRGFALSSLMLIGCTVIQYTTSVYGEGNEVTKHLSIALFAASLAPVLLAAGAMVDRGRTGPGADAGVDAARIPHQVDADGIDAADDAAAAEEGDQPQWLQPLVQDDSL
ncbi:MAG TPA: hypothetical protein VH372_03950 [Actinospica sp.]|nr:hypothetical protein [Actinospica sp.]